jgi:hypothetical protein
MKGQVTEPRSIRVTLETEMMKLEEKSSALKQKITDITTRLCGPPPAPVPQTEFGDKVELSIGPDGVHKTVRSMLTFEMLLSEFQSVVGPSESYMGFQADRHTLIWVRTISDVKLVLRFYYSQVLPNSRKRPGALRLVSIPPESISVISQLKVTNILPYRESLAVFKVESAGPRNPLVLLPVERNWKLHEALPHFQLIFGLFHSMTIIDDEDDTVAIDEDESWKYALETASRMGATSAFPLLIIE